MSTPTWLRRWLTGDETGISSLTIVSVLTAGDEYVMGATDHRLHHLGPDAPHDTSDVGRCVHLLDAAEAGGAGWRARMPEMVAVRSWRPLVPHWPAIEAAYHRDVAVQTDRSNWTPGVSTGPRGGKKRTLVCPPALSYWLCEYLRNGRDMYEADAVHPFAAEKAALLAGR